MTDETRRDSDSDGLSDAVERRLGTNVNEADSDGDGLIDGFEVAVGEVRVRDLSIKDPAGSAAIVDDLVTNMEQIIGVTEHNADSDGDGFADWVEEMRGGSSRSVADLTADDINQSGANRSPLDAFISRAQSQIGAKNRFGAEVDLDDSSGAAEFDSSELVQWAAHQAGAELPDGSWHQYRSLALSGNDLSVEAALGTKGALLFGFSSDPMASADRPDRAYVAISLGNGRVLEISERTGELTEVSAFDDRKYTHAATIPQFNADAFDDTDGDRWYDIEEELLGGDPTRGVTTPWRDSYNIDSDGDGVSDAEDAEPDNPAVPNAPDPATTPDGGDGASDADDAGTTVDPESNMPVYDPDPAGESAPMPQWDPDAPASDGGTTAVDVEEPTYVDESAGSDESADVDVAMSLGASSGFEAPTYGEEPSYLAEASYVEDSSYDGESGDGDAATDGWSDA